MGDAPPPTRRLRRRDLGRLAAAAAAAWALPAWAQEAGGGKDGPAGGAPGAGPPKKKTAVDLALGWLARHQDPDGRWNSDAFSATCRGAVCTGDGESVADPRTTGLALLAFLGAGETHQSGDSKVTVKEALKYLRNVQDTEGCIGPRVASCWLENHLAAALALAEAYGMTQSMLFKECAVKAVAFALAALDPAKGFRSAVRDAEPTAAEVGELVLLLKSARLAKLLPDQAPFDAAWKWFDERLDAKTLTVRASDAKAPADALADDAALTYAGLARVWCPTDDAKVRDDALIAKIADRLAAKPPVWSPAPKGKMSYAAWSRRAEFLFQAGGDKHVAWCRALGTLLNKHQCAEGCAAGSWDPADVDAARRGRIEATAQCALANEIWYRYGRRNAPPQDDPPAVPAPQTPGTPPK